MTEAVIYCGFKRETEHHTVVEMTHLSVGAGQCACLECGGTGDWTPFYQEPLPAGSVPCVDCKGTGKVWVSI